MNAATQSSGAKKAKENMQLMVTYDLLSLLLQFKKI